VETTLIMMICSGEFEIQTQMKEDNEYEGISLNWRYIRRNMICIKKFDELNLMEYENNMKIWIIYKGTNWERRR
jgi:hypothetical protein